MSYILEVSNVSKAYPGVQALKKVELRVKEGTVHAVMGENGAGKSTLMKILIGIEQPDEGEIVFLGQSVRFPDTHSALYAGLSMIHQELSPVPYMTVAENIFLGKEPIHGGFFVNDQAMINETAELLKQLEIDIDPRKKMIDLSVAQMQMIEITKAISYNSKLIIMDEPTSALTEREVNHLFRIIKRLQKEGVSIIFITHKMDEVYKVADEISVYRDGTYIETKLAQQVSKEELIQMMVGREIKQLFPKETAEIRDIALSVEGLTRIGVFEDISFNVRKGEILGFAGLVGSGRTEVLECVFGITRKDVGKISINNKPVTIKSPRDALTNNMALLPEDRKLTGLYLVLSVHDNITVAHLKEYEHLGLLNQQEMLIACGRLKDQLSIKTPNLRQQVVNLSGGNQQKVLIARWLLTDPDILILDEPTRGIDVGSKSEIHKIMTGLAKQGKSIVMISSELPEILGMSDRILVMHEGRKTGELLREEATQEKILHLATGETMDSFDPEMYR